MTQFETGVSGQLQTKPGCEKRMGKSPVLPTSSSIPVWHSSQALLTISFWEHPVSPSQIANQDAPLPFHLVEGTVGFSTF